MTDKQNFATKSDLRRLETKVDGLGKKVSGLGMKVENNSKKIDKFHREILAFKWEIDKRLQDGQERMERLVTKFKDEIVGHIDPVMKELARTREEQAIMGHQINQHEEKLANHEVRVAHLEATPQL